jgi:Glycosyltransferase family 9 (heptosyltransferase)
MKISVKFRHGLGDCCNFAHMIPMFLRRGYEIGVECEGDKKPLFIAAGATLVDKAQHDHQWLHPSYNSFNRLDDHWNGNKTAYNINHSPMPYIGNDYERWQELCDEKLSLESQSSPEIVDFIQKIIQDWPRPIILMHTKGNCAVEGKNIDDVTTARTYELLLNNTEGTVVLLDWDNRVPWLRSGRIKRLKIDLPHLNLLQLYELMQHSDLLIGIDSGPLHFARFTKIPTLGVWTKHYTSHFVLPSPNAVHLVPKIHEQGDKYRRLFYNTILAEDKITAEEITKQALRVLSPAKYIKDPEFKARDTQLQNFVDRLARKNVINDTFHDRNISFDKVLTRLSKIPLPTIVETGCIRQEEDWSGAGFASYFLTHFAHYTYGKVHSVDISEENCNFARKWTEYFGNTATIYKKYSSEFLKSYDGKIDFLYTDSADVGTDKFQEICLEEVQLAQKNMEKESMILIDDTWEEAGALKGKGALAVPWLKDHGWERIYNGYQQLLVRKT